MTIKLAELEASFKQEIENDSDFQSSIADLTDEEKTARVSERRSARIDAELERLSKSAQNYESQRIRAEKAEKEAKELKDKVSVNPVKEENGLSPKDYLALTEAKVTSEDFDEVVRVSKVLGKNLTDTLKDKTMQMILQERVEQRKTDEATAVKARRPVTSEPQGKELLSKAVKGQFPDSDDGIAELVEAEHKAKLAKIKR